MTFIVHSFSIGHVSLYCAYEPQSRLIYIYVCVCVCVCVYIHICMCDQLCENLILGYR